MHHLGPISGRSSIETQSHPIVTTTTVSIPNLLLLVWLLSLSSWYGVDKLPIELKGLVIFMFILWRNCIKLTHDGDECASTFFISQSTEWNSIKFGIHSLQRSFRPNLILFSIGQLPPLYMRPKLNVIRTFKIYWLSKNSK
jgi:hypothetical protein